MLSTASRGATSRCNARRRRRPRRHRRCLRRFPSSPSAQSSVPSTVRSRRRVTSRASRHARRSARVTYRSIRRQSSPRRRRRRCRPSRRRRPNAPTARYPRPTSAPPTPRIRPRCMDTGTHHPSTPPPPDHSQPTDRARAHCHRRPQLPVGPSTDHAPASRADGAARHVDTLLEAPNEAPTQRGKARWPWPTHIYPIIYPQTALLTETGPLMVKPPVDSHATPAERHVG